MTRKKVRSLTNTKSQKASSGRTTRRRRRANRSPEAVLAEQLELIKTTLATANQRNVLDQYPICCSCRDIRDNVDERFGKTPIKKALEALDWSRAWFGKLARLADRWPTEDAIVAVSRRVDCRGVPLSWCHLVELACLETALFEKLLDEALEKGLSVRDLKKRIAEEQAGNKGGDQDEGDEHAAYEADDYEPVDYDITEYLAADAEPAEHEEEGDEDDDEVEDAEADEDQDDDEDGLAGSASDDDRDVHTADADASEDPVEAALAYFESGGLDVKCEFVASAGLDATSLQDITPEQRCRLEIIAADTEEMLHLLGLRLISLNRVLEPEETPRQRSGNTAGAKAAA